MQVATKYYPAEVIAQWNLQQAESEFLRLGLELELGSIIPEPTRQRIVAKRTELAQHIVLMRGTIGKGAA